MNDGGRFGNTHTDHRRIWSFHMPFRGEPIPLEQYLADAPAASRALFEAVRAAIESVGTSDMRVTKSQVAFRRRVAFAWAWMPRQYLPRDELAPLVLSVGLRRRDGSMRWKDVVEPSPGRFVHHMELRSTEQLDDEVLAWLREAWGEAA